VKIGIRRLEDLLGSTSAGEADIEQCVKEIENTLSEGLQRFPGDSYLLEAEAVLAKLLDDSARALSALERAFAANPRSAFLAIRLSVHHRHANAADKAKEVLERALEANPGEKKLHFEYAKLLMVMSHPSGEELAYHLKRSFVPGDTNYLAQILYGRQLFINGEIDDSRAVFRAMDAAHVGADLREGQLYPLEQSFRGSVIRLEATYCFIARDGLRDWIFAHRRNIDETLWRRLAIGARTRFRIAFSMRGARAFDVVEEN
jgi:tetratricopeptide (TPR) repeat protein